jgi:hypothetical protein
MGLLGKAFAARLCTGPPRQPRFLCRLLSFCAAFAIGSLFAVIVFGVSNTPKAMAPVLLDRMSDLPFGVRHPGT